MAHLPRRILLLLFVALGLRLAWAVAQPQDAAAINRLPDQREYLSLGQSLLHGSLSLHDLRFDQTVHAYRTPGYPVFVALYGASPMAVRIAQAVVDTSTVFAVYLIAWQLCGTSGALLAGAMVAFHPFLIYFTGLILTETLFTALLAWGTLCFIRQRWFRGGLIMLLAAMVRPPALVLGPLLAGAAVIALNPAVGSAYRLLPMLRRASVASAIVASIVIVGLLPWAWRNHRLFGEWIWTTTNGGVTLYDGFNPGASGASDQRFLAQMPQLRSMNEVQRSAYLQEEAKRWARENTIVLPRLTIVKIARTWSPVPLSDEFGRPLYVLISAAYAVPFDLLVIAGLFSRRLTRSVKLLLLTPAIFFTIVHAMSVGSLRYRMPSEPELAVLATFGALSLFSGGAKHRGFSLEDSHEHPRV